MIILEEKGNPESVNLHCQTQRCIGLCHLGQYGALKVLDTHREEEHLDTEAKR